MILGFFFLTLALFFVLWVYILTGEIKKPTVLYSLSLITIFYTPSLYFYFGGTTYRFFNNESLVLFFHIGGVFLFIYGLLMFFIRLIFSPSGNIRFQSTVLIKIYFSFFVGIIVVYYAMYFKSMPLMYFLISGEMIDRPDLTGSIPHFYTISSLVMVYLGSTYFYYFDAICSKYLHVVINLLMCFIYVMAGHKGFVVYYCLFLWVFVFKLSVDFKIFAIFFALLFVYMLTKGITHIDADVLAYMMDSPFRRFFVTQGTGFIHRLDLLEFGGVIEHVRGIKFAVFQKMYNVSFDGSAPTFYTGDLIVKYGYPFSILIFIFISSGLLFFCQCITKLSCNKHLFLFWNFYVITFLISMAEISFSSSIRILLVIINLIIVYSLGRITMLKTSVYRLD